MVKVVFCKLGYDKEVADELGDCYILISDNWDDYGYKTSFFVHIYKDYELYETSRKILLQNQNNRYSTEEIFTPMLGNKKYVEIGKIKEKYKFISLGNDYDELIKIFPAEYTQILHILNDVIYLENKNPTSKLLELKNQEAFEISLCRDQSFKKFLEEGKALLFGIDLDDNRFDFEFSFELNNKTFKFPFNFNAKEELPHNINVLVGKNGSGKSQTLLALSEYLLGINNSNSQVNKDTSFLSHMLIFAYNPNENFIVPRYFSQKHNQYNITYKYIGYRRYKSILDVDANVILESEDLYNTLLNLQNSDIKKLERRMLQADEEDKINNNDEAKRYLIDYWFQMEKDEVAKKYFEKSWELLVNTLKQDIMSKKILQETLFQSFCDIYTKDRNNYVHAIQVDEVTYIEKVFKYINKAFSCNAIGLKFINSIDNEKYLIQGFNIQDNCLLIQEETDKKQYTRNVEFNDFESQLYFFNYEKIIPLSSGQQTFIDLIINLLSLIKNESLILIDEPENTLHPNLEVDFMRILQSILNDFDSFAIIATHSATIVREVPSEFVHVIKFNESGQPVIQQPSIKTFGADIGTITNYIFDDIFKDEKPFENWFLEVKEKYKEKYETFDKFEEKYRAILNYDFLLYCKNSWSHGR
jgi:predicted ATPase